MATIVRGLTRKQGNLLKDAFGYESYPNGNSGHTRKAVQWLLDNFSDKVKGHDWGEAGIPAELNLKKIYLTHRKLKELKKLAESRGV